MRALRSLPPFALLATAGCDSSPAEGAPAPSRYEAVTAKSETSAKTLSGFCDVQDTGPLVMPAAENLAPLPPGSLWINVWATWCKSCVEELPMIENWSAQHKLSVVYLSADEDPEALSRFRREHPELPLAATLEKPGEVGDWMQNLGLDAGAGLPLHLFVSPQRRLRCARAAAVQQRHLPIVASLLE